MFQKGNKLSKGRPRISLQKPELLLPAIFGKVNINWQHDFIKLYKMLRTEGRELNDAEKRLYKFFLDYMPYLCTKIALKELDANKLMTPADSLAQAKVTSQLLQALEAENSGPSSTTESAGH